MQMTAEAAEEAGLAVLDAINMSPRRPVFDFERWSSG